VADSFDAPGTRRGIPFSEVAPSSKLGTVLTLSGLATEVSAREVGLDPDRLARLVRYLDNYVAAGRQKGSLIAICRGGKLAHVSMRGTRDEAAGLPVEADTVWRIYSMTKPITSVAAMMLYEEGALSLFDPVSKYIPSFEHVRVYRQGSAVSMVSAPAAEPMLIWHLLTHTAGLTYDFMFSHPVDELYRKAECDTISPYGPTLVQMCDRWASIPLLFEPCSNRGSFHYVTLARGNACAGVELRRAIGTRRETPRLRLSNRTNVADAVVRVVLEARLLLQG